MEITRVSKQTQKPSNTKPSSISSHTSTSTSLTDTTNGSHDFKISGYSLSKGMGIGKYVASRTFFVGGHLWAIYFYPDGKSTEDIGLGFWSGSGYGSPRTHPEPQENTIRLLRKIGSLCLNPLSR